MTLTMIRKFNRTYSNFIFFVLCSFASMSFAIPAKRSDVEKAAAHFLHLSNKTVPLSLRKSNTHIENIQELDHPATQQLLAYVVNLNPFGFIIVGNEMDLEPVIAYSYQHDWNPDTTNANLFYHLLLSDLDARHRNL